MKTQLKTAVLILSIAILFWAFSGCERGKSSDAPLQTNTMPSDTVMAYVPEYISLPEEIGFIINVCFYEDRLYLAASLEGGAAGDIGAETPEYFAIYKMNMDGSDITRLEDYKTAALPDDSQSLFLTAMSIDPDGNFWVIEYDSLASVYYLRKLDAEGGELLRSDISYIAECRENTYINDMMTDGKGNIYLSDFNFGVYVFNDKGIKSFEANSSSMINNLVRFSDGTVAAFILDIPDTLLRTLDPEAKGWGTDIPIAYSPGVFSGSGEYDCYYNDGSCLYGYSSAKRESTEILSWLDCNMDGSGLTSLTVLPDGAMVCFTNRFDGEKTASELVLLEMRAVERETRTVLKLACLRLDDYIQSAVRKFNNESKLYKIEVVDYSQYNTQEDMSAGYLKLDTEIISGNIPDIICADRMLPVSKYIAHGLLVNLYPYLDKDSNLGGRNAFIPEVLAALETDGALYTIAPGFSLYTVIGSADVLGEKESWTYDDIFELLRQYPEGTQLTPNATAKDALSLLSMNMDKYINWQTGECRFNDENFIQLLELAGCFPVSPPVTEDYATQLRDGRALIITDTVRGFFDFQVYRAMFQRDVSCIGFPSESGSDNRFMLRKGLSITSKCEHKEAAWEFISFVISEEYQVEGALYELPTNKAAFESYADKAMQSNTYINEEGEVVEYPVGIGSLGDFVVDIYAATKEDVELVRRLIADTKKLAEQDLTVLKIIQEEALGYFNDQCSASDAASIIQSRVSTYINEQR